MAVSLHLEGVIREGVYTMVGGPNYETVAELNLLRELGVDSVGTHTFCLLKRVSLSRLELCLKVDRFAGYDLLLSAHRTNQF